MSDALRKDRAPSVGVDGKNAELWHTTVAEFSLTERHMVMDEVANSSVLAGLSLEVYLTKHWGPAATSRTFVDELLDAAAPSGKIDQSSAHQPPR